MATKTITKKKKKLSVLKRARQSVKHELRNMAVKSKVKTFIKKLETLYAGKDKAAIEKGLKETIGLISSAASKGVIHKNTASRKISRVTKRTNKVLAS